MTQSDLVSAVKLRLASRALETPAMRAEPSAGDVATACGGFQEAAAVLVAFDIDTLKPVPGAPLTDTREALLSISEPLLGESNRAWTLQTRVRVGALRQLRATNRLEAALNANPERMQDPAQQILESYIKSNPPLVESLSFVQLTALQRVADWLRLAEFPGIPDDASIQNRADWFKLLQPFEHLAGDDFFRGRQGELARLRSYVGVVNPGITENLRRTVVDWITRKSPLLIYGPGGVGKSTLVSRFILEHARAREQDRFPFIYLDFDRPEITGSQPLTLLIEAVRQLGIEYQFERPRCERVRQSWLALFRGDPQSTAPQVISSQTLSSSISEFASLLASVVPPDCRVVMVLDTFEEVQYRSDEQVAAVWNMLEQLRQNIPSLCAVVVGRATIPAYSTEDVRLDGFDSESAIGYLAARGISNPTLAAQIAKLVGGNPMSLHLAADLAIREGIQSASDLGINTREYFFIRLGTEQIQRQLYTRVLSHVHDPKVRTLAQPGLVLHRITTDLIYEVLNEPCSLELHSREQAEVLFSELKRERALVQVGPDGALVHRPELRKQTLRLLCQDAPEKASEIRHKAVDYYAQRPPAPPERAEEIYHRLALGEDLGAIGARWIPGIEPYLQDAFDEFSGAAKAFLATRLRREVDAETLQMADLQDWENIVKRKATDLLASGFYQDVLKLIGERTARTAESELYAFEATALFRLGRFAESFRPLHRGIEQAIHAGERRQVLLLLLQAAQNAVAAPRSEVPQWLLDRLKGLPEASLPPEDRVALNARKIALADRDFPLRADPNLDIDANLRSAFDELKDIDIARRPEMGWWAATSFGTADVARLRRVIANASIPQKGVEPQLRELAARLTSFDVALSRDHGETSGALARELQVPLLSTLTATWSEFLISGRTPQTRDMLVQLLAKHESSISREMMRAITDLMMAGVGILTTGKEESSKARAVGPARSAPRRVRGLARALENAYTPLEFDAFLRLRLAWSLDSIANTAGSFYERINDVVNWAIQRGQQTDLVEAALLSRPGDATLIGLASELGIPSLAAAAPELSKVIGSSDSSSLAEWMSKLGLIEPCVGVIESADGRMLGTGFLVGPDLMLTAAHVLSEPELRGQPRIRARFDQKGSLTAGSGSGMLLDMADDWLVTISSPNELDFAILRLRNSPGSQPIGSARAEHSAALRGWIHLDTATDSFDGEVIVCPNLDRASSSLHLAIGRFIGPSGARVRYELNLKPGASGAPCFSSGPGFKFIGIITGVTGEATIGTSASAISGYLLDRGLDGISGAHMM